MAPDPARLHPLPVTDYSPPSHCDQRPCRQRRRNHTAAFSSTDPVPDVDPTLLNSLLNIGGVGVIAAALIWVALPKILDHFSKAQAALIESHDRHIDKIVGRLDAVEGAVRDLVHQEDRRHSPLDRRGRTGDSRDYGEDR